MEEKATVLTDEVVSYEICEEPFYIQQKNEIRLLEAAYKNGLPVMLTGPTGSGKTRLIQYVAWKLHRPLYTVACHDDLSANDLVGRFIIKGDEVRWIDGPLLMAVKNGGIVYLDEIVEARKDVTVVIHPLTDHRRSLPLEKLGKQMKAPPEFMLVTSYNPNYQSVMKELKPSTRQRFIGVELGWPDEIIETKILVHESGIKQQIAEYLVKAANKIRNLTNQGLEEGISTRELVYAAKMLISGIPVSEALHATMIEPLTHDADLKTSIEEILKVYFSF